jgi:hypothetical protein
VLLVISIDALEQFANACRALGVFNRVTGRQFLAQGGHLFVDQAMNLA